MFTCVMNVGMSYSPSSQPRIGLDSHKTLATPREKIMRKFLVQSRDSDFSRVMPRAYILLNIVGPYYADAEKRLRKLSTGLTDSIVTPYYVVRRIS
jgi:hypothetical protein